MQHEDFLSKKYSKKPHKEQLIIWINRAKEKTLQEVKKAWLAIEAVAKEVIAKEVIDGEELKKIIAKALG